MGSRCIVSLCFSFFNTENIFLFKLLTLLKDFASILQSLLIFFPPLFVDVGSWYLLSPLLLVLLSTWGICRLLLRAHEWLSPTLKRWPCACSDSRPLQAFSVVTYWFLTGPGYSVPLPPGTMALVGPLLKRILCAWLGNYSRRWLFPAFPPLAFLIPASFVLSLGF